MVNQANVNAQNWLDTKFNNKNTTDDISLVKIRDGEGPGDCDELIGELLIKDYVKTKKINFERKSATNAMLKGKITKVIIENCPDLEVIDFDNNEITEVIFKGDLLKLKKLDVKDNHLRKISACNFPNVEILDVLRNPNLTLENIWGIEYLRKLKTFDFTGINNGDGLNFEFLYNLRNIIKNLLGVTSGGLPNNWETDIKNKLGGKNLQDIPSGQTLASLIAVYNSDKGDLQNQLTKAQAELDKKKDYDAIKAEWDQLKQQLAKIVNKLGLASGATDKQIEDKITELMNKPSGPGSPTCSHTDYDSIKSERDRLSNENTQLKDENKKLKEKKRRILSNLTNLEKNGIKFSEKDKEKIENAGSAEKTEEVKSEIIGGKFNELKGKNDNSIILNIGLGVLAIGSLLILGWVLMRQTNLPQTEPEKEKKK